MTKTNYSKLSSTIFSGLLISSAVGAAFIAGCSGGGGGGDGDSIDFSGSLTTDSSAARLVTGRTAVPNVTVCALGGCSTTDDLGQWGFSVDGSTFAGGDVLFSFLGNGVNSQTVVPAISPSAVDVTVDFVQQSNSSVGVESVDQSDSQSDDGQSDDGSSPGSSSSGSDDSSSGLSSSSSGDDDSSSGSSDDDSSSSDDDSLSSSSSDDSNDDSSSSSGDDSASSSTSDDHGGDSSDDDSSSGGHSGGSN